jgi:cupin fold WbuC family metalloprotein
VSETVVLAGLELRVDRRGKSEALYAPAESVVDRAMIAALKERLAASGGGTIRICLHAAQEAPVHDMVIVHKRGSYAPAHRHETKDETYQLIEGRLRIDFYDDAGKTVRSRLLGEPESGLPFMIRIPQGQWHATVAETEFVAFHESRPGPFNGGDSAIAGWEKK